MALYNDFSTYMSDSFAATSTNEPNFLFDPFNDMTMNEDSDDSALLFSNACENNWEARKSSDNHLPLAPAWPSMSLIPNTAGYLLFNDAQSNNGDNNNNDVSMAAASEPMETESLHGRGGGFGLSSFETNEESEFAADGVLHLDVRKDVRAPVDGVCYLTPERKYVATDSHVGPIDQSFDLAELYATPVANTQDIRSSTGSQWTNFDLSELYSQTSQNSTNLLQITSNNNNNNNGESSIEMVPRRLQLTPSCDVQSPYSSPSFSSLSNPSSPSFSASEDTFPGSPSCDMQSPYSSPSFTSSPCQETPLSSVQCDTACPQSVGDLSAFMPCQSLLQNQPICFGIFPFISLPSQFSSSSPAPSSPSHGNRGDYFCSELRKEQIQRYREKKCRRFYGKRPVDESRSRTAKKRVRNARGRFTKKNNEKSRSTTSGNVQMWAPCSSAPFNGSHAVLSHG